MNEFSFAPSFLTIYCQDFSVVKNSFSFKHKYELYLARYNSSALFKELVDTLKNGANEKELVAKLKKEQKAWYQELIQDNLIFFNWEKKEKIMLSIFPVSPTFRWVKPQESGLISKFAYLRRQEHGYVLESPQADCKITNISPSIAVRLMACFDKKLNFNRDKLAKDLFYLLDIINFLEPSYQEENLKFWEFHDYLFHYHSTINRPYEPFGATYPFAKDCAYPKPTNVINEDQKISLPPPDQALLKSEFFQILDKRQSSRNHGLPSINLQQISELLFISCKVKTNMTYYPLEIKNQPFKEIEIYHKAYPSAGGINELKFYLIINQCEGIAPGVYLYDDVKHHLFYLPKSSKYQNFLLNDASFYWGNPDCKPQMLLLITSQIHLLSWKYQKISYRLTLLNGGGVIQTVYLVASKLNLACCALGGINSILFNLLHSFHEIEGVPITELALGSKINK